MRHFGGRDDLVVHVVPNNPDHFLAKTAFNFEYETAMCNFPMSCCAPMFWLGCVLEEFWHKVAQITSWAAGKKWDPSPSSHQMDGCPRADVEGE
jgi:hypothetical protein